jgi:hypothetical protein
MAAETITIGVQTSGEDTVTHQHVIELRKLLASECKGPYSEEIREFALVLRVGGIMQEFDFLGCERIRRTASSSTSPWTYHFRQESGRGGMLVMSDSF